MSFCIADAMAEVFACAHQGDIRSKSCAILSKWLTLGRQRLLVK